MVRGLWALALEGQSPPGSAATLMACLPAVTAPQLCVVATFLGSVIVYCSVISNAMFCTGTLMLTTQANALWGNRR